MRLMNGLIVWLGVRDMDVRMTDFGLGFSHNVGRLLHVVMHMFGRVDVDRWPVRWDPQLEVLEDLDGRDAAPCPCSHQGRDRAPPQRLHRHVDPRRHCYARQADDGQADLII